jgi:hypothetical protein
MRRLKKLASRLEGLDGLLKARCVALSLAQ